jgi:hypothetical protein
VLPRYLVPVLPAFCILAAGALHVIRHPVRPVAVVALVALFAVSVNASVYRVGRFVMGAYNDHAGYQSMTAAYRDAFAFVDSHCPEAVVVATYPADVMARDPRFGYVMRSHDTEVPPPGITALDRSRAVLVVRGDTSSISPAWTDDSSVGKTWMFGAGISRVDVLEPYGSACAP